MTGAAGTGLERGEVLLTEATRAFSVRADHGRTLRGVLTGRGHEGPRPVAALDGVTLRIAPGEIVGIVGRNGAGKSSTLRVLAGIIPLQAGFAGCGGRVVSLIELAAGFSRDFSGRENIYLQGALYGFERAEIDARVEAIIAFSELGEFIDVPIRTYSLGMFLRLGFSIAAHLDADVLLIDEVLAVGDDAFQRKCLHRIAEQIAGGTTIVLVSHDLPAVERICRRLVVLDHGRVAYDGAVAEGLAFYRRAMGTDSARTASLRGGDEPGGLEVVELELQDREGRPAAVFAPGESLRLMAAVHANAELSAPVLALEFATLEGAVLFRSSCRIGPGVADEAIRVGFEIERLGLLGGDFHVLARAGEAAVVEALPAQRMVTFSVAAGEGGEGSVDLRGTWSLGAPVRALP